jgi:hypothetical protein
VAVIVAAIAALFASNWAIISIIVAVFASNSTVCNPVNVSNPDITGTCKSLLTLISVTLSDQF